MVKDLFKKLEKELSLYRNKEDILKIKEVFEFAKQAHKLQKRKSGEPYIIHPLNVAIILAQMRLDAQTIIASLLHDVVEDTDYTLEDIENLFGKEVANLVDGVTKITKITGNTKSNTSLSKEEYRAQNLRKIIIAMAKDVRVILIKLADRLHNLRTLSSLKPEKQKVIAKESLEIFAPLTHRLGLWHIKRELEDLSFKYLYPEQYNRLSAIVNKIRKERADELTTVISTLEEKLDEMNIPALVEGRPKHLYSIYRKMKDKNKDIDEIYDLVAIRVITDTVAQCYAILGAIHGIWMPVEDRIKDYIAKPKSNNYQSLHTTVYGPSGYPLEIQIRTWDMHEIAQYGIAAHWHYKEKYRNIDIDKMMLPWIKQLIRWQKELAEEDSDLHNATEYIQTFQNELLETQIFVFTPNGDVVDLPKNSTPIDFAYRIHTEVGHRCIGAKVNGKIVPLNYKLKTGDIVSIITSNKSNPSRDWLNICKTSGAKHKIRGWFRKQKRDENIEKGKEIFQEVLKKFPEILKQKRDAEILSFLVDKSNYNTQEDFFAAIGFSEISNDSLFSKIRDFLDRENEKVKLKSSQINKFPDEAVKLKGIDNILIKLAKCCNPLPGDKVLGFITIGKGLSIHRANCPNLKRLQKQEPERILKVQWSYNEKKKTLFESKIEVTVIDRAGIMKEIMEVISNENVNISSVNANTYGVKGYINFTLQVRNVFQLEKLITKIDNLKDVLYVRRI